MLLAAASASPAHAACIDGWTQKQLASKQDFFSGTGHPLIGVVWTRENQLQSVPGNCGAQLSIPLPLYLSGTFAAAGAGNLSLLILGEVHDNPVHHRLRAALLEDLTRDDRSVSPRVRPALVFEHIGSDQQPALDQFAEFNRTARRLGTAGDLFGFLDWKNSGWPDQKLFAPLFSAAVASRLPILAGDAPRGQVRAVAAGGASALAADQPARAALEQALDAPLQDALLTELEASHCSLMPKARFTNMALAQRYRDTHLAQALLTGANQTGSAILFAGNGHARADRGVPYAVRQLAPSATVTSVLLIEVEDGKVDPGAYVPRAPDGAPAADIVIFTPRADREDPCVAMKKQFAKPP